MSLAQLSNTGSLKGLVGERERGLLFIHFHALRAFVLYSVIHPLVRYVLMQIFAQVPRAW